MAKKIVIGIPTNRLIKPLTTLSLLEMVSFSREYSFEFIIETEGLTVEDNRNNIVKKGLKYDPDFILFIDDDMVFPKDTLIKMIATDKDIVGVNAYSRGGMTTVGKQRISGHGIPKEPFICESVGTGIMLVKVGVFNKIKPPHFNFERDNLYNVKLGEDVNFCRKARTNGFEVWCNPTIPIKHIGDFLF